MRPPGARRRRRRAEDYQRLQRLDTANATSLNELLLRQRDQGVVSWIGRQRSEDCFLSVVSIVEIQRLGAG